MTYLLDVNLLIALLDPRHVHNTAAHQWAGNRPKALKWATCPIIENAFVRITGNPAYPNFLGSATASLNKLRKNISETDHRFWADDISLCDPAVWTSPEFMNASQITDCYLLALAAKNGGKLASFDRRIPAHLVRGGKEALHTLPS
jgi:toxin-antitoxin system PIN domain toxin